MTEFHHFVEPLATGEHSVEPLRVPLGVSHLSAESSQPPHLTEYNIDSLEDRMMLEVTHAGHRPRLVVISQAGGKLRINGQPTPRVALLRERDQVQIAGMEYVLHVALYHGTRPGPPSEQAVGRECPVCRGPINAATAVYVCDCGAMIHCEGEEKPADERLECLKLSTDCPVCGMLVALMQGYSYVPEL